VIIAVLAEHRRHGLVKERKIEVRDVYEFEFGVIAFSRNVISPLAHGLALPAGPRAPDDNSDFKHDSPSVHYAERLRGDRFREFTARAELDVAQRILRRLNPRTNCNTTASL